MTNTIAKINASPVIHHNKSLNVQGVVRAAFDAPFPHFLLEDKTGTLLCKSMNGLPGIGAHIEVAGEFFVGKPENCSIQMTLLNEQTRSYIGHSVACGMNGCEFATKPHAIL
jgi:hypothetical protein